MAPALRSTFGEGMSSDLIAQGVELMLAGMGTVIVFLTALVVATALMSRLVMRLQGGDVASVQADAEKIAVVTAAIVEHRRKRHGGGS